MKRIRVVVMQTANRGTMYVLPDPTDPEFDPFYSTVENSQTLVLTCHPEDERMARDHVAVAQEHAL